MCTYTYIYIIYIYIHILYVYIHVALVQSTRVGVNGLIMFLSSRDGTLATYVQFGIYIIQLKGDKNKLNCCREGFNHQMQKLTNKKLVEKLWN